MNSLLLHRLVKVVPFAMSAFMILMLAHGVYTFHGVHVYGDPGGSGAPNLHVSVYGDPGGSGAPN
jgi:hypothetical protein